MNNKNFQTYFDCGFSKIRAGTFNKDDSSDYFCIESKFFSDYSDIDKEIQKIITYLEKNTNQYLRDVNLMIDSSKMLSIGISVFKKIDGSKLRQDDIQFLIQEAKQQILKYYNNKHIAHIIINNYKIDDIDYSYLPFEKKCNFISLDIFFICLPNEIINYFKLLFNKLDISVNQIYCSSYAKSVNYIDNFSLEESISFIDVGFNKTTIISFIENKFTSLDILLIGGNHITKDISKVLKIDLDQAENIKLNFDKNENFLMDAGFSIELLQKIVFARTEEILEICAKSIKLNLNTAEHFKMILTGGGSKILDNQYKDKILFSNDIDFLEETVEDICNSGFKLGMGLNNHEVLIIPKKQTKQGFFEKLFHLFK